MVPNASYLLLSNDDLWIRTFQIAFCNSLIGHEFNVRGISGMKNKTARANVGSLNVFLIHLYTMESTQYGKTSYRRPLARRILLILYKINKVFLSWRRTSSVLDVSGQKP